VTATATQRLAIDAALPQRDLLLSLDVIAERLADRLAVQGLSAERCERIRANYQIGKSLRLVHRLDLAGGSVVVAARAFKQGRSAAAFRDALATAVPCGSLPPVAHDPELETVFWTFPNDRKILTLPEVSRAPERFESLVPHSCLETRIVAYAPEKSATLQVVNRSGVAVGYAKVCARDQGLRDYQIYERLWRAVPPGHPYLAVPRPLTYDAARRTLLLEAVNGRRLADFADGRTAADVHRLGSALASFHSLDGFGTSPFGRFSADRLREAADALAALRPDVAALAAALVRDLLERRPEDADDLVLLHGDVHPKNAIFTGDRVTLIDVEDVATGPAAADLASLLAGLDYLVIAGRLDEAAHGELSDAFLTGYDCVRARPSVRSLQWHRAAALLVERAYRAVTRLRPLGLQHLNALLAHAHRVLTVEGYV
jgi:aminoglycoside phosphotransferase